MVVERSDSLAALNYSYDAGNRNTTNVESKIIDFWKEFNRDLGEYVTALSDDTIEDVTILGRKVKKDSAAATYLADKWQSDTTSVIERLLSNLKNESDVANKLFSMFGS